MNLYLLRHGDAVARGGAIATDSERPLSKQGEEDARRAGELLAATDPAITLILTSPLLRAVETGRLIAGVMPGPPEVVSSDALSPGSKIETIVKEVIARGKPSIVAVGHQPDLGTLMAWLVADQGPATFRIPPGAVACIEMQPDVDYPRAGLRWLVPPDMIRTLSPK